MKVLVNDAVAQEAVDLLSREHEVDAEPKDADALPGAIGDYHAIVIRSGTRLPREVLERADSLKVIARAGVGVDNVDLDAARERGIAVVNSPAASSNAVAELTVAHVLALARNLQPADATLREGRWEKKRLKGVELDGRTLGLVGVGRIGARVAELARAFGMSVVAFDPYVSEARAREMGVELVEALPALARRADVVSVHVPLTDETRGIVGADLLAEMKPTALLVNCSRGGVVDEAALYDALKSGGIGGAALDVFETEPPGESPLFELPNFRATPHLGASTAEAQVRAGVTVAEDVLRVLRGEEPENRVV